MATVTRFAPSPTGRLHLGHAYAALFAADRAARAGGRFLVRIEDIDRSRCRPEFEAGILEDLAWLGLEWEEPVRRQSDHMDDYADALASLDGRGLIYPCFCTRREIEAAATAPHGPEGPPYPGTCRALTAAEREARMARGDAYAVRLTEGDTVVARKDIRTSYHLAVVVDDALQGVTLGDARRGPRLRRAGPEPPAAAARPARSRLRTPSGIDRRQRPPPRQARPRADPAKPARGGRHSGRSAGANRANGRNLLERSLFNVGRISS